MVVLGGTSAGSSAGVVTRVVRRLPSSAAAGSFATARRLDVTCLVRVGLAWLCLAVVLAHTSRDDVATLGWLLAAVATAVIGRRTRDRFAPVLSVSAELTLVCFGVVLTGGAHSALLAYLPAPLFHLGTLGRNRLATWGTVYAGLLLLLPVGSEVASDDLSEFVDLVQWLALALAFGLVAAWAARIRDGVASPEARDFGEAHRLLARLHAVTDRLPASLDSNAAAETLLDRCQTVVDASRAAVLVHSGEQQLVPLSVRGMRRVPWRDPGAADGPLAEALATGQPVLDVRGPDITGRRSGSALFVLPILVDEQVVGLVALESPTVTAFTPEVRRLLEAVVREGGVRLQASLLFDDVRMSASMEAREHLAAQMHDGVAQDLAYLGFELDVLRQQLGDTEQAGSVARVRGELTRLITDVRLSITDLRNSVGPDRGLGSALSSYVRGLGTGSGLTVHLTLDESGFRLPADVEVQVFRLAQRLAGQVRRSGSARNLWVGLTVDPPTVCLTVEHDGAAGALDPTDLAARVTALGGELAVDDRKERGQSVSIRIEGAHAREHTHPARR